VKRLLGGLLFAMCACVVVAGCGTQAYTPRAGTSPEAPSSKAPSSKAPSSKAPSSKALPALSPRQRAVADAAAISASFVPPPGARRLTRAPGADGGALKQPFTQPASPNLVDDPSWWLAPGQPQAVLAWEQAHLPRRFTSTGTGEGSGPGESTVWSQEFSLPVVPAVLDLRQLVIEVVSAGHGQTAIRVDSQVTWLPAKPAAERVPAAARSVTITAVPGLAGSTMIGPVDITPHAPVTITNQATLRRIESLADGLPVFPPGMYSCPADNGSGLTLTFRGASGRTLAVVAANATGCETVSFTVGGKSLPALWGISGFVQQVLAAAHLHWST
jgi:hypothetical protein